MAFGAILATSLGCFPSSCREEASSAASEAGYLLRGFLRTTALKWLEGHASAQMQTPWKMSRLYAMWLRLEIPHLGVRWRTSLLPLITPDPEQEQAIRHELETCPDMSAL